VAITKVAAFIQGPPEAMRNGFSSTPEADLVSALMYLRNQVREPLPYVYMAQMYVPFFLVHALPGRSLIISGIGEPTISVRHSSPPSLVQLREKLRSVEKVELVPNVLGAFIQMFDNPPSDIIVIRNAMLPTIIDTLQVLVDSAIAPPRDEICLRSRLSTKEIHDVGILFRNERSRLDGNLAQLAQAEHLLEEFVDEQLRLLDAKRDRMSPGASLRWERPPLESEPSPSFFADESIDVLEKERERISLELADLVSRLEKTLGLSTEQCRRLINQIKAKPTDVEWHLANVKTRLVELQNSTEAFRTSLQKAFTELESKTEELRNAEQGRQRVQEELFTTPSTNLEPPVFPSGTLVYSGPPTEQESVDIQLNELDMIREAIVKLQGELRNALKKLKGQIEQEHRHFEAISAPADTLQGYLPLMRLDVPIFVLKINEGEGRYGVIPPLRIHEGSQSQYDVTLFDEVFGEQLIQLMRTEIRTQPLFRQTLDEKARGVDWITRPLSAENIQRGTRQLANYGLLTYETREIIANYWERIIYQ
jgi:hypothetical protein